MNIIVTGGAGFIGSHLVDKLIVNGHRVLVIDDLSGGFKKNLNKKAIFFKYDLRNYNPNRKNKADLVVGKFKPRVIFHLAANAAENKAQFSPADITSRNFDASIKTIVLGVRYGMKRFVYTSSIAVYGALQTPFKETDKPEPEDLYGISKLAMEQSLKVLSKIHDFEYVITRPHNVYGPRQNMNDPYRNVATIFMNQLMKGLPYVIYGDGKQKRCFSYIDDVVDALYKCGFDNVGGGVFNVGADKAYTINELSDVIQAVSGIRIPPKFVDDRPQEVKLAVSDHTLAKKHLGYVDKTPLIEGIKLTWEYAKNMGPQKATLDQVELPNNKMPKNWKIRK
jgi:UDP-glucose 4-epimerase